MDIHDGWGYWGYLWGYLGARGYLRLPGATSEYRNPGDHGYLWWLGLLGLPLGLPGATWVTNSSMLAGATGATSGATWGYL
jgi:hypothetical protein